MEVGDVVMRTGDDETSTCWCFAFLLESGSDEHLCTPKFADLISTSRDRSPLKLKDVQKNVLVMSGQKTVPMLVGPTGGKHAMEATATFRVAEVRDNILSLGKHWFERVSASIWVLVVARWKRTAGKCRSTWNETVCVWRLMLCSAHRDLDTWRRGTAVTGERDERMDGTDIKESHASTSAGPPAPVLKMWWSIKELHSRLRELGAPIYGTKDVLSRWLCEYEKIAARKKKEDEYLESRRKELAVATEPVTPKILLVQFNLLKWNEKNTR